MDEIKIRNFIKEYQGKEFPFYRSLKKSETEEFLSKLCNKVDLKKLDKLGLVKKNNSIQNLLQESIADFSGRVELGDILSEQGIKHQYSDNILINWYRFEEIDEINLRDVENYFDDLWYVRHDGKIK